MGWIKRSRRKVESIIIPVCLSLLSFQYSTGYSSICRHQEADAEDPSPKTEGERDTLTRLCWFWGPLWFEEVSVSHIILQMKKCVYVNFLEETIHHHMKHSRPAETTHRDSSVEIRQKGHCSRLDYKETLFKSPAICCKAFSMFGQWVRFGTIALLSSSL